MILRLAALRDGYPLRAELRVIQDTRLMQRLELLQQTGGFWREDRRSGRGFHSLRFNLTTFALPLGFQVATHQQQTGATALRNLVGDIANQRLHQPVVAGVSFFYYQENFVGSPLRQFQGEICGTLPTSHQVNLHFSKVDLAE